MIASDQVGPCREALMDTAGRRLAEALAIKDADRLRSLSADEVDFRGMTPGRDWSGATPHEVVDGIVLGHWFAPSDEIRGLVSVITGRVVDCGHVAYRLEVRNGEGDFLVEQQAYYTLAANRRIGWMRVMCSGFRSRNS